MRQVIEQVKQTRETLDKLLAVLESAEHDRRACEIAGKSGKEC